MFRTVTLTETDVDYLLAVANGRKLQIRFRKDETYVDVNQCPWVKEELNRRKVN